MTQLLFVLPSVEPGDSVRVDTASGSNTPATVYGARGGAVVGPTFHADPSGALPHVYGADGVTTLYLKHLNYKGTVTGSPVTVTGVDDSVAPPGPNAASSGSDPTQSVYLYHATAVPSDVGFGGFTLPDDLQNGATGLPTGWTQSAGVIHVPFGLYVVRAFVDYNAGGDETSKFSANISFSATLPGANGFFADSALYTSVVEATAWTDVISVSVGHSGAACDVNPYVYIAQVAVDPNS